MVKSELESPKGWLACKSRGSSTGVHATTLEILTAVQLDNNNGEDLS